MEESPFSSIAFAEEGGTNLSKTSFLIPSPKWVLMTFIGAFPGRNPGIFASLPRLE